MTFVHAHTGLIILMGHMHGNIIQDEKRTLLYSINFMVDMWKCERMDSVVNDTQIGVVCFKKNTRYKEHKNKSILLSATGMLILQYFRLQPTAYCV